MNTTRTYKMFAPPPQPRYSLTRANIMFSCFAASIFIINLVQVYMFEDKVSVTIVKRSYWIAKLVIFKEFIMWSVI